MSSTPAAPNKGTGRIDPLIGTLIAGKYKIIKKIGEGGMGSVYIADQQPIDRKVAIKVLLGKLAEDDVAVKRFEQEARAISKMQHPHTVTIYDFGRTEDEQLYIVMEFLKGHTLTQLLRKEGVLVAPRACKIMRQVCGSLADAHAAGIIHRDLKPDNIFLSEVGGDPDWVKVLDFGVAKLADNEGAGTLTQTGMIFGTPKYMSPEQAEGRPIDYRADIYALGVVMYELLVGRPPFVADTPVGLLLKHISEPPAPFSRVRPDLNIDPRVEAIVMKSLEKHPDRRQSAVVELANELGMFERMVTGQIAIGGMPTAQQMVPGLPTEVVPGAPGSAPTPHGLAPPNQVPGNLSLSVPSQTKDVALPTGSATAQGTHPLMAGQTPTAMSTAGHNVPTAGVMPFAPNTAPVQAFTHGLTSPIAAPGGGVDTLGGVGGELSGGLQRPTKPKPTLLYAGVGLVVVAIGVGAYAMKGGGGDDVSIPIEQPVRGDPPPVQVKNDPPKQDPVQQAVAPVEQPKQDPPATGSDDTKSRPLTGSNTKRNERTQAQPREAAAPAPARTVTLRISSNPEGATVLLEGKQVGMTPLDTTVPRDDTVTLVFKKSGYDDGTRVVVANGDRNVSVDLVKQVVAVEKTVDPPPTVEKKVDPKVITTKVKQPEPKVDPNKLDEKVDDLK